MFNTLAGKFGGFAGGSSGGLTFSYAPTQTGLTGLTVQKNDSNYWLIGGSHPGGDSPSNAPNTGFYVFTTASDFTGRISMWGGGGPSYRVASIGGGGAYVQTTHTFSAGNTYKAYVGGSGEGTFIFLKGGPSPSTAFNPVDTLVVVAGGGGQSGGDDVHGPNPGGPGGAGGYPSGAAGTAGTANPPGPFATGGVAGGGGTQSAGGAGGGTVSGYPQNPNGLPGSFIYKALGGATTSAGGVGGGGYYGGGGGEGPSYGGPTPGSGSGAGGGGGSSHANSAVTSSTTHSSGTANTAGGSPTRPNPSPYWGLQGGYGIGQQQVRTGGPTSPIYNSWTVIGNVAKTAIFIDDVS